MMGHHTVEVDRLGGNGLLAGRVAAKTRGSVGEDHISPSDHEPNREFTFLREIPIYLYVLVATRRGAPCGV
jgi:hypothetical protein